MHNHTLLSGKSCISFTTISKNRIKKLFSNNIQPGLAAVLIGKNPASEIYIKMKTKKFMT